MGSSSSEVQLRDLLRRRSFAEICARTEPDSPLLEGLLHEGRRSTIADAAADAREAKELGLNATAYAAWRAARRRPPLPRMVSGEPLASESHAPFVLDGAEYRSVWCFYQCLKLPEAHPDRAAVAMGRYRRRRGPSTGGRTTFAHRGEEIAVGSPAHGALIGRAVEAKAAAHEHVREALLASGTCLLWMGSWRPQALARYMPFALMVVRLRLWGRPMI